MKKNFGNAGAVHKLLDEAVERLSQRRAQARAETRPLPPDNILEAVDLFEAEESGAALLALSRLVNADPILERVRELELSVIARRERGTTDPSDLLTNWTFVGPPGTGKTTVARAFGSVFNRLGLLPDDRVVEVKGVDLMAGFVGQTPALVNDKMDEARGGVLFIDEAYALDFNRGNASGYAREAVETLLANLTDIRYKGKLIVVLAGYAEQIDGLLACNVGLSRRFPERLTFQAWSAAACTDLALRELKDKRLTATSPDVALALNAGFERLSRDYDGFGSAGDAIIAASKVEAAYDAGGSRGDVNEGHVSSAFTAMFSTRSKKTALGGLSAPPAKPASPASTAFAGSSALRASVRTTFVEGESTPAQDAPLEAAETVPPGKDLGATAAEALAFAIPSEALATAVPSEALATSVPSEALAIAIPAVPAVDYAISVAAEAYASAEPAELASASAPNSEGLGEDQGGTSSPSGNDAVFDALLDALTSRGYSAEDSLDLVVRRFLPDELVADVAARAQSSPSEARTALLATAPAAQRSLEAVVAEITAARAAQEAIRLAFDAAQKARLIAEEQERVRRMLRAMVCDVCGRQGCPVAPRLRTWLEGTKPPFQYRPYNGNNGPAVN